MLTELEIAELKAGQRLVTVYSRCRCREHNKSVGGKSDFQHLFGNAADISVFGVSVDKLARIAEECSADGIGIYKK